jgi:transposase
MEKPKLPAELLQKVPPEIQVYIAYLEKRVDTLETLVKELEGRLNLNSQNSSKPPSSDPPSAPPRPSKEKSGKKQGGQPGHTRHIRELVPVEKVDEVKEWWPTQCRNPKCNSQLNPQHQEGSPIRQQVTEISLNPLTITEHQYYACSCSSCGEVTRAVRPPEVPAGMFGAELVGIVASLHGRFRLTEREIVQAVEGLWGLELSLGSVAEMCQEVSEALAKPYQEILLEISSSDHLNVDETGWKLGKMRQWLWVAVSGLATVFLLNSKRDKAGFRKLVSEIYKGTITSDRFSSYNGLEAGLHQWCWAHLMRDFRRISERGGEGGIWGEEALELSGQVFEVWGAYCESQGEMSLAQLQKMLEPIRSDFDQLLCEGKEHSDGKVRSLSGELLKASASMWVFSEVEGVEPTNNAAERALRPAVIWRKTCFGNQSEGGLRFVERMLTVSATLKQQGRDLIKFVVEALRAKRQGLSMPSLLSSSPSP